MDQIPRQRLLIFVARYLPGYKSGGPIRSISGLAYWLGKHIDIYVVTSDRDSGDTEPYPGIAIDEWVEGSFGEKVFYVKNGRLNLRMSINIVRDINPDLIYLNSFYNRRFTIGVLLALCSANKWHIRPIIAPRGEFSAGALKIKFFRKQLYISFFRLFRLHKHVTWHATNDMEKENIESVMGKNCRIHVASNLCVPNSTDKLILNNSGIEVNDPIKIVYLSRIVPKKNLHFALECLKAVKVPCRFTIYGPKEDLQYWQKCEGIINELPAHIQTVYKGPMPHENVSAELQNHDLFFFPTAGENFGHVILEALLAGLPLLISDQTPWLNLENEGVGWDIPLNNPTRIIDSINSFGNLSITERQEFRRRALEYGLKGLNTQESIEDNMKLFLGACQQETN